MTRVKKGLTKNRKHKNILKAAKGYRGSKSKLVRSAKEAIMHAGAYAFAGRKDRKSQMRRIWITKITAALEEKGIPYSKFIKSLKEANIELNRKMLADLAETDPSVFAKIISQSK